MLTERTFRSYHIPHPGKKWMENYIVIWTVKTPNLLFKSDPSHRTAKKSGKPVIA